MSKRFLRKGVICALVMFFAGAVGMFAQQQQKFSLDDLPHQPYTGPMVLGYGSAEDEYGIPLPASFAGLLGGSPSLFWGFYDSDILIPGLLPSQPSLFFPFPLPPYYMDAFSYNHKDYGPDDWPYVKLQFSVDRATGGTINGVGSATYQQAQLNQQPADVFESTRVFPHPGTFPPPPPVVVNSNTLLYDDSFFKLRTGWVITGPGVVAPAITMGTHDNIDGFNELPPAVTADDILYFSVHAAEIVSPPCSGLQSGDIYVIAWGTFAMFAPAASMGLNPVTDSIDGLVVWDLDNDGYYDPEYDYALYSLAPGSATLTANPSWDGGTVFWTTFTGNSTVFAWAPNLGVGTFPVPPLLGDAGDPNVDALEIKPWYKPGGTEPDETEPGETEPNE